MARKFKTKRRVVRRPKRGRRLTSFESRAFNKMAQKFSEKVPALAYAAEGPYQSTRAPSRSRTRAPVRVRAGTMRPSARRRRVINKPMAAAAAPATIKYSPGLTLGTAKIMSFHDKVRSVYDPPQSFNSKWTWTMNGGSARVTACQIPILSYPLMNPIQEQLLSNLTTDTAVIDPTINTLANAIAQYKVCIQSYRSNLRFYNSSSNTLRARLVWYKPARDLDSQYETFGANSNDPINMLMIASNYASPSIPTPFGTYGGTSFLAADYNANYNHCGAPITGSATTTSNLTNTTALLDPDLVPGSPQVRSMFSNFWTTLKSEEFTLEPGNQYNTSVTLLNRMYQSQFDDADVLYQKETSIVGVIYIIGQMVFADAASNRTITTGSTQLSIMREDTCTARPVRTRKAKRMNLTAQFQTLLDTEQAKINIENDELDDTYVENT